MCSRSLALQVAVVALPCLSSAGDPDIRRSAELLFEKLAYLDGDGVWLLLLQTLDTANTTATATAAAAAATPAAAQGQGQHLGGVSVPPSHRRASRASSRAGTAGTTAGVRREGVRPGDRLDAEIPRRRGWKEDGFAAVRGERVGGRGGVTETVAGEGLRATPGAGTQAGGGPGPGDGGSERRHGGGGVGSGSVGGGGAFLPDPLLPSCSAIPGLVKGRPSVMAERRSVFSGGRIAGECAPSAAMLLGILSANGSVAEHM